MCSSRVTQHVVFCFFYNDAATTEIYTRSIVGSVRCVQETVSTQSTWGQAACYGIGIIAQKEGELFCGIASSSLTKLEKAIAMPRLKQPVRDFEFAKSNAISAIGKILKYQHMVIPFDLVWEKWLPLLPFKKDREELNLSINFFLETVDNDYLKAVGKDFKSLKEIIRVIVDSYKSPLLNEKSKNNLKEVTKRLCISRKQPR
eukprot:TRINITY_DN11205_c0_g1_i2.p1 TRINITY_DN11205_c0_g1~~TRINITY_DN11205_c0_g1_i2.p1  ORF type:complete len:202 (-),score=45.41 TRINITY_DN11205_c0_g1_i2:220-825(-)